MAGRQAGIVGDGEGGGGTRGVSMLDCTVL